MHVNPQIGIAAIHRRLVQAVVASSSPLVGKTVRKYGFRTHFGAAIIAIHRQGERLRCKIGDAVLKAGDVLLLDTGAGFVGKYMYDRTFALLAEVENSTPTNTSRMLVAGLLGLAMVLSQIIGAVTGVWALAVLPGHRSWASPPVPAPSLSLAPLLHPSPRPFLSRLRAIIISNGDVIYLCPPCLAAPPGPFIDLFTAALLAAAGMLATGCLTGDQVGSHGHATSRG